MQSTGQKSYGKEVLIGNWSERRYEIEEKSNAVVPAVRALEGCEQHQSVTQATYTKAPFTAMGTVKNFADQRGKAFANFKKNETSNMSLLDHISMNRNFTTTSTLAFEVLPQRFLKQKQSESGYCGPPQRQPEIDMLQSFGNLTQTHNYPKRFRCEKLLAHLSSGAQTTYGASYNQSRKNKAIMEFGPDYDGVVQFDLTC
ncbi:uncharacterized protein LOC117895544 [Drosophila subobscura]|uniref:uncharacterized protein LOC117895544 n=1 Tax=Drosophila subobscura TaxID=7241 RepID=UPI00155B045E|nr:uncharacterized protein LOC117895544 [Drosophila subobscura]